MPRYAILRHASTDKLAFDVQQHLNGGWILAGGVVVERDSEGNTFYCQAIYKMES